MVNTGSLCGEVYEDHIDVGKDEEIKDATEKIKCFVHFLLSKKSLHTRDGEMRSRGKEGKKAELYNRQP